MCGFPSQHPLGPDRCNELHLDTAYKMGSVTGQFFSEPLSDGRFFVLVSVLWILFG